MSIDTQIEWTNATWNIARGCTKVDADCKFCYMYRDANRFKFAGNEVVRTKQAFYMPLKLKKPSLIFVSSLTDFFHPSIDSFRNDAWDIISQCPQHIFQILTKRPERISNQLPNNWQNINSNIWLGTSIGSQESIYRLKQLVYPAQQMYAASKYFLSLEPLHGPIHLPGKELSLIDWIIIGGESGNETGAHRYRPCQLEWIEKIVDQCKNAGIPVFVKQMGTYLAKKMNLSDRHGRIMHEWPAHLQIRQFPQYAPWAL